MLIHQGSSPRKISLSNPVGLSSLLQSKGERWLPSFACFLELAPSAALSRLELSSFAASPTTSTTNTDTIKTHRRGCNSGNIPPRHPPQTPTQNAHAPLLPLPSARPPSHAHHDPPAGKDQSHRRRRRRRQPPWKSLQQAAAETLPHSLKHALAWAAAAAAVGGLEDSHRTLRSVQERRDLHRQGGVVRDWARDEG